MLRVRRKTAWLGLAGLILLGAGAWAAASGSDANEPLAARDGALPRAVERVWRRPYFVRDDLARGEPEVWLARLDRLLDDATTILQDRMREGDAPCPIRLARGDVRVYRIGDPDFPRAARKRGELAFPGRMAGVYLAPGPGPSFATGERTYVWVQDDWARLETSAAWALAHEHGHNAGLRHLDVAAGAPCTLMSYGKLANGCGGGRLLAPDQCRAYLARATETGGPAPCLLADATAPNGVRVAPHGTPCSDGSGICDVRGRCRR